MKKLLSALMVLGLSLSLFAGCSHIKETPSDSNQDGEASQGEKLSVCTSFYPMYDFASKIGGDKVSITNMVPAGVEPHDWEPTAADIAGLEKASVFIYNGAGMEHWVEDVLKSLKNENLIVVEASNGVTLIEGHHDHDDTDTRGGESDPHVWLDPMNAKKQMENIKDAFCQGDPENKDYYQDNLIKYSAELDKLDKEFRDALTQVSKRDIVVSHKAFGYLCAAYDLNQIGIGGLNSDFEPDSARMAQIIDFVKEHDVKVIFFAELTSPKVADTIANDAGAETAVLSAIEGLSDEQQLNGDDYFCVMRQNLEAIKSALQ